jgi:hypothetical protein
MGGELGDTPPEKTEYNPLNQRSALLHQFVRLGTQDEQSGTTTITYSFALPDNHNPTPGAIDYKPMTDVQQREAEAVFREIESVANIKFVPSAKPSSANIIFSGAVPGKDEVANERLGNWAGMAHTIPNPLVEQRAVVLNRNSEGNNQAGPNASLHGILLHEVLHTMGFSHPGEQAGGPNMGGNSAFTRESTILSYNPPSFENETGRTPRSHSLATLDIHALQEHYGAAIGLQPVRTIDASAVENEVGTLYAPKEVQITGNSPVAMLVDYGGERVTVYRPEGGVLVRPSTASIASGTDISPHPDSNHPVGYIYYTGPKSPTMLSEREALLNPKGKPDVAKAAKNGFWEWLSSFGGTKAPPSPAPQPAASSPAYQALKGAKGDDYFELMGSFAEITTGAGADKIVLRSGQNNRVTDFDPDHDKISYNHYDQISLNHYGEVTPVVSYPEGSNDAELRFIREVASKPQTIATLTLVGGAAMSEEKIMSSLVRGSIQNERYGWQDKTFRQLLKDASPSASADTKQVYIDQYNYGHLYLPEGASIEFNISTLRSNQEQEEVGTLTVHGFDPAKSTLDINADGKQIKQQYSSLVMGGYDTAVKPVHSFVTQDIIFSGQPLTEQMDDAVNVVPKVPYNPSLQPSALPNPPSTPGFEGLIKFYMEKMKGLLEGGTENPAASGKDGNASNLPAMPSGVSLSGHTPEGTSMDISTVSVTGAVSGPKKPNQRIV